MSDDRTKTGQDRQLISLEQPHELRDWMKSMHCSEEELWQAVKVVGHSADAVRTYLHGAKK